MSPDPEITTWHTEGILEMRALISPDEVECLRDTFDMLRASGVPSSQQALYTHFAPPPDRPAFGALMEQWLNPHARADAKRCASIVSRVQRLLSERLGEALFLFQDVLMSKSTGHRPFPWHQDEPYWPVMTIGGAVIWCALDPVDRSNGALELASGSHRLGLGPAIDLHTGEPQHGTTGHVPDLAKLEHRCLELAPGDAVLFHPRSWHRSGPNVSGAPRRAWSSSWLPASARWCRARAPRHPLAAHIEDGASVADALAGRSGP